MHRGNIKARDSNTVTKLTRRGRSASPRSFFLKSQRSPIRSSSERRLVSAAPRTEYLSEISSKSRDSRLTNVTQAGSHPTAPLGHLRQPARIPATPRGYREQQQRRDIQRQRQQADRRIQQQPVRRLGGQVKQGAALPPHHVDQEHPAGEAPVGH